MNKFYWVKEINDTRNVNLLLNYNLNCKEMEFASIKIATSGIYKLYVNGKLILFGPSRTAKGYVRFDEISCSLQKGKNQISMLMNEYGAANYVMVKQEPFFSVSVQVQDVVYTTEDFIIYEYKPRVRNIQRYSFQRGFCECYQQQEDFSSLLNHLEDRLTKYSLKEVRALPALPRRIELPEMATVFSDGISHRGEIRYEEEREVWRDRSINLVGHNFEGYTRSELKECMTDYLSHITFQPKDENRDTVSQGEYVLYHFERNLSGFIGLELQVEEDTELYVIFDELLIDNNVKFSRPVCANVVKWELKKGHYKLETLEIYTLKYAQIIVRTGKVKINSVSVALAENKEAYKLNFHVEDEQVTRIVSAAKNTMAQNSIDLLMDCPSRERSGWINDMYFSRKGAEVLTGNLNVEHNSLENFALCPQLPELPEGMVPMTYPADHINGQYVPNCAMWYVINACEFYIRTKDKAFLSQIEKTVFGVVEFFKKYENEYDLLENLESWVFVEWSVANSPEYVCGVNFPSNMTYYKMLCLVAEIWGNKELHVKCDRIKENIIGLSYNGEFFEDNVVRENGVLCRKNHISEACQYHAFFSEIATQQSFPQLFDTLKEKFVPSRDIESCYPEIGKANIITGVLLREKMLVENGLLKQALQECKEIFYKMAELTDTLWEVLRPTVSCNHAVSSYVAYIFVRIYTGFIGLKSGTPIFAEKYIGESCTLRLPLEQGILIVKVEAGKRTWFVEM